MMAPQPSAAQPPMDDPHDLQRFVDAQAEVIEQVFAELRVGRKRSHWIWFVFPQIAGLGHSAMAVRYAIASRDEALAYLRHPVLGPRLTACTTLVNRVAGRSLHDILGHPDELKFHSSMTLFAQVAPDPRVFDDALAKFCEGRLDEHTVERLQAL